MSREALESAIEWRCSLDSGEVTLDDRKAFFRWLAASPENAEAFAHAEAFWAGLGDLRVENAVNKTSEETAETEQRAPPLQTTQAPKRRSVWLASAATILIVVSLVLAVLSQGGMFSSSPDAPSGAFKKYETRTGEIQSLSLADGSRVILGAASVIRVREDVERREVIVLVGDVFFDVARDEEHPFTVDAGDAEISVLGTAFEIRRSVQAVNVAVSEGVVAVAAKSSAATRYAPRSARILLAAGEGVAARNGELGKVRPVDRSLVGSWQDQRLVYNDATLARIIADANRYDARNISLQGEAIKQLTITATFDFSDIDQVLATLAEVFPLEVEHIGAAQILISPKN
ncbi:MAG: FecR domain-containing protein [Pseudomonadota bacterium]